MGTKNNPGSFDCHASAEDDEPLFTLLARDRTAPHIVRLWAAVRDNDGNSFDLAVRNLIALGPQVAKTDQAAKLEEARRCSDAMIVWRSENRDNG